MIIFHPLILPVMWKSSIEYFCHVTAILFILDKIITAEAINIEQCSDIPLIKLNSEIKAACFVMCLYLCLVSVTFRSYTVVDSAFLTPPAQHNFVFTALQAYPNPTSKLKRKIFWTSKYIKPPSPINYPADVKSLSRSVFTIHGSILSNKIYTATSNKSLLYREFESFMHPEFAVFSIEPPYKHGNIRNFTGFITDPTNLRLIQMPVFHYALIYVSPTGKFLIFQMCNKKYAWLQVENKIFKESAYNFDTAIALDAEIKDTLSELRMTENVIDTEDNRLFEMLSSSNVISPR